MAVDAIGILFLVGVVVLLMLLLWKKTRRVGVYVGIGIVVLGLLVLFFRVQRHTVVSEIGSRQQTEVHPRAMPDPVDEVTTIRSYSSVDPAWDVTVENEFEADVYPSIETAAKALGRTLAPKVEALTAGQTRGLQVMVTTRGAQRASEPWDRRAAEAVWQELNTQLTSSSCVIERVTGTKTGNDSIRSSETLVQVIVGVSNIKQSTAPWSRTGQQQTNGSLEVTAQYGSGTFGVSAAFIEKPWVTNYSMFLNQEPGRHYLIAQSKQPCTNPSEARSQAMEDAAEQLANRIIENANPYRWRFNVAKQSPWNLQDVKALVRAELEKNSVTKDFTQVRYFLENGESIATNQFFLTTNTYICDRFVQQFHRSYGSVWREALLVDASKKNVDALAKLYARGLRSDRQSWFAMILSVAGMLALVCVVYVFLNAATKGYYKAALRVAAVVLVIAILVIVMVWT